jgi:thioredoxin-related protein
MKKIALLFAFVVGLVQAQAQVRGGINFFKGTLKSAFALAQAQNKPLFVEIYAIGCPHCENFKKTFDANAKVGAFYNKTFINYQLEVNSPEAKAFRQKHNIYVLSTPLMSFWDKDENYYISSRLEMSKTMKPISSIWASVLLIHKCNRLLGKAISNKV